MSRLERDPQIEALVAAYCADLEDAGIFAENEVTSPARSFLLRVGLQRQEQGADLSNWAALLAGP